MTDTYIQTNKMVNQKEDSEIYKKTITFNEEVQVCRFPRLYEMSPKEDYFYQQDELPVEQFIKESIVGSNTFQNSIYDTCTPSPSKHFDEAPSCDETNHLFYHKNMKVSDFSHVTAYDETVYCFDEYQQCHDANNPYTRQVVTKADKIEFPKTLTSPKMVKCRKKTKSRKRQMQQWALQQQQLTKNEGDWVHWY